MCQGRPRGEVGIRRQLKRSRVMLDRNFPLFVGGGVQRGLHSVANLAVE
jgi:hypothetical protein